MRRLSSIFAFLAIAICAAFPVAATPPYWAEVDALVDNHQPAGEPGISLAISVDGEPVYHRWSGQADLERGVAIGKDTRFFIGSTSKQFTAFAVMLLVDEGRITLDQDIRTIIPELEARDVPVTIRHLLNHTSGLREIGTLFLLAGQTEKTPTNADQALDMIYRQRGGNFQAGERQEYSNTGYELLAEIVARVSGEPFPQFMQTRIFAPLGMDRTFVRADPNRLIPNAAISYEPNGEGFAHAHILAASFGSTGIVSDPVDLLRWGHALNMGQFGGTAISALMDRRSTLPDGSRLIGTNGQEYRSWRGLDTWSHGGSTGGFRTFLLRIPEARTVIAVAGNRSDFLKAAFAFDVAEKVLVDRLDPEPSSDFIPATHEQLDSYAGDYRLFAGVVFSLRRDGDALMFSTFGQEGAFALPQIGDAEFMLNPARDLRLVFKDFKAGQASRMRWTVSADGYIPAPRVEMEPVPQGPIDTGALAGTYYSDTLQQALTIYELDGKLWARTGDALRTSLERYQPDTFRPAGEFAIQRIRFERAPDGPVETALISTSLADNIVYRKLDHP
ncbi:beta-lactamase family protein [Erythrobacter insulae]|uniref:Beta-lactamase family protein n=1 Tax=Erythrobacter insulae TaxID=2584124 RepID=A0A547PA74_9SPHN|nr:serine hydrolase domain-containing protein [Erythrobacter insulae]TRD11043.1 beta-lactamase family protein [Erythrobacter insulae]